MSIATRGHNRALIAAGVVVASLLAILFMPVSGADAARLTACVKKKSGQMKLVSGKKARRKCPKGWRKVAWNTRGPAGPQLKVRARGGVVVGKFRGISSSGTVVFIVERSGGIYAYYGSGELLPTGSPRFTAPDCSGSAYILTSSGIAAIGMTLKLFGGLFRIAFRTSAFGVFGPVSAWKSTGTFETIVSQQTYELNSSTGACDPAVGPFSGELILLKRVAAPPDFKGPLYVK